MLYACVGLLYVCGFSLYKGVPLILEANNLVPNQVAYSIFIVFQGFFCFCLGISLCFLAGKHVLMTTYNTTTIEEFDYNKRKWEAKRDRSTFVYPYDLGGAINNWCFLMGENWTDCKISKKKKLHAWNLLSHSFLLFS